MILRAASSSNPNEPYAPDVKPAFEVFIQSQKAVKPPYAIIFQAEHSRVEGLLASALRQEIFGALSPEVIQGIGEHDYGWEKSDRSQLNSVATREPLPFPRLSTEETVPSWNQSVAHAHQLGPLQYVIVSRHFTLLGGSDPGRAEFVLRENQERRNVESSLAHDFRDLDRWTAAIGFCDLLSLYLCSGSLQEVKFPLAHPADPSSSGAQKVTLRWEDGSAKFSSPILQPGATVSLHGTQYVDGQLTPITVDWDFR
ncbi:MAG: DUF3891 family protein [Bryobacteraceae bacterium]